MLPSESTFSDIIVPAAKAAAAYNQPVPGCTPQSTSPGPVPESADPSGRRRLKQAWQLLRG